MAHQDPVIAAIQNKTTAGQRSISIPIHPAESKALAAQVPITDSALSRKLAYANTHSVSVTLTDDEMKLLLSDIVRSTK